MSDIETYLTQIYYNPSSPASFSGVDKIFRYAKNNSDLQITRKDIQDFLAKQETYTEHKQVFHRFSKSAVITSSINYQWDVDLASLISRAKYNKSYKYFLVAIDCFSKFIHTRPLKSKQPTEVAKAFEDIFTNYDPPERIRSDKGMEFSAKIMAKMYEKYGISHFVSQNVTKANLAERGLKTLKSRLMKAMQARNSHEWVDLLPKITEAYNNSYHRTIGMRPAEASKDKEVQIWERMFEFSPKSEKKIMKEKPAKLKTPATIYKYQLGDAVKLAFSKYVFQREYSQRWTTEVFFISERYTKQNIQYYIVKDYHNKQLDGRFQNEEIQKVEITDETEYKIEKVLNSKFVKGEKYLLVKWENYSKDFNSWVKASEVNTELNKLVE